MTPSDPARRLYGPTVLSGLAAGGLAYFAASRVWTSTVVQASGLPSDPVTISGTEAMPVLGALALVIAAAAIAILAASVRFRKVVAVILALAGLIGAILTIPVALSGITSGSALETKIQESPAFTGANNPDVYATTSWPILAVFAFFLAVVIGALVWRLGSRWPTMGRKYDAPAATQSVADDEGDADLWKALDQGRDPTQ